MKIAMFVEGFPVRTETFIVNQIAGLLNRGHDIEIYSMSRNDPPLVHPSIVEHGLVERTRYLNEFSPAFWHRLRAVLMLATQNASLLRLRTWQVAFQIFRNRKKRGKWSILSLLYVALENIHESPHDILHCQFGNLGPRVLFLKQTGILQGKLVTSFRGHDATQQRFASATMYAELFREGDLFLPVSHHLAEHLIGMGCSQDKLVVLHSGVDTNRFSYQPRLPPESGPVEVLSIARFIEMKGLEYGIRAIANLVRRGYDVVYTIIGDGVLGAELEQLILDLGLSAHVNLVGWKDHEETRAALLNAHILVAPSVTVTASTTARNGETEGIPNVVKEAMATGMPVISTYHGGIPELVKHGVSGYLVQERNVDELTNRLAHLLDHPSTWVVMGRAGRSCIEEQFDNDALIDRLIACYEHIISRT